MWRFILYNWDGIALGEITPSDDTQINSGISENSGLSMTTLYTGPLKQYYYPNADLLVAAYRWNPYTGQYIMPFVGPVFELEIDVQDEKMPTVGLGCVGPAIWLGSRIANTIWNTSQLPGPGKTESGIGSMNPDGTDNPLVGSRSSIVQAFVRNTNSLDGPTWIDAPDELAGDSSGYSISNAGGYKYVADFIDEMSNLQSGIDGFEWTARPTIDFRGDGSLILGNLETRPLLGTDKTDTVIFEHGLGRNNCVSSKLSSSRQGYANRFTHLVSGADDVEIKYAAEKPVGSQLGARGVWDTVVDGDFTDPTLRKEYLVKQALVRARPKTVYEFEAMRSDIGKYRVPIPYVDYDIGDRVRAMSLELELDAPVRVWNMNTTVGVDGNEKAAPKLYSD